MGKTQAEYDASKVENDMVMSARMWRTNWRGLTPDQYWEMQARRRDEYASALSDARRHQTHLHKRARAFMVRGFFPVAGR